MHIKRYIAGLAFCLAATATTAQNGINMPYTQLGIGLGNQPFNSPLAARMGGVIYTRTADNLVNPYNPASYGSIGMESFVFDMALGLDRSTMRNSTSSMSDGEGNIGHLLLAMPITKRWKIAAGLMPYTTVDYESVGTSAETLGTVRTVYSGTGGASQLLFGTAFNLGGFGKEGRTLMVGANVGYLTGHIQKAISYALDGADTLNFKNSRKLKDTKLGNLTLDFGLQLREPLGEKYTASVGVVYKPHLKSHLNDKAYSYTYYTSTESVIDYIFPLEGQSNSYKSNLEQASTLGIGLSLERNRRWMAAVDLTFAEWNGMRYNEEYNIFGVDAASYDRFSRYAVALEKMGDMDAASYVGRMSWSLGAHVEQGLLYVKGERIDGWGVGGGVTLPMRKGKSLLSLSVSYSSMGETSLLQRNCLSFGIGVSSCERWFVKRKYN